jgi:hypothetical protein
MNLGFDYGRYVYKDTVKINGRESGRLHIQIVKIY